MALRAATDLATMLGGAAGRRALAPLYERFREGLDTAEAADVLAVSEDEAPSRVGPWIAKRGFSDRIGCRSRGSIRRTRRMGGEELGVMSRA